MLRLKPRLPHWLVFVLLVAGYLLLRLVVQYLVLPQSLISLYPWVLIPLAAGYGRQLIYPVLTVLTTLSFIGISQTDLPAAEVANALIVVSATSVFIVVCIEVILYSINRLRRANHDLASACAQAESASVAKGKFLAVMSHEVRTPLSGILGMTEMLAREESDLKKRQSLSLVHRSAEELMLMINSILDFSRLESGKMELHPDYFPLRTMMAQLVTSFRVLAEKKHLQLELIVDSDLPEQVFMDKHRLRQVLANLLTNAIKFTQIGHIELSANRCKIDDQEWLEFVVKDTGIGIASDRVDKLFEPFEQVNTSYNRAQEGTGLGLSIARDIVKLMGADIVVRSTPGLGSRFSFRAPLVMAQQSASARAPSAAPDRPELLLWLRPPRVLLAEDSDVNRSYLEAILRNCNCDFVSVVDGQQALDAAMTSEFDLYLFDLHMPNMSGFDALRAIRTRRPQDDVVAVALTACNLTEEAEEVSRAGFVELFAKPMRQQQLVKLLSQYCRESLITKNS